MGNYNFTVGEITSQIKKESKMNMAQIGNTAAEQDTYIWYYMTMAMWKYVGLVFKKRTSDPLTVSSNGYVTFKVGGVDIDDLYTPIRVLTPDEGGNTFLRRSSFDAPSGWFKETANDRIHIKGTGTYVLQYRSYPAKASAATQILEWPASSYDLLMFETIGKIKESLNDLEGATAAYAIADKLIPVLIKANTDNSQGTTGGALPTHSEVQFYRR